LCGKGVCRISRLVESDRADLCGRVSKRPFGTAVLHRAPEDNIILLVRSCDLDGKRSANDFFVVSPH
jgi:hypothetical protein